LGAKRSLRSQRAWLAGRPFTSRFVEDELADCLFGFQQFLCPRGGAQRDDRVNDHADRARVEQRQHISGDASHDGPLQGCRCSVGGRPPGNALRIQRCLQPAVSSRRLLSGFCGFRESLPILGDELQKVLGGM
jgi:hypothetical protein